jgi:hypothetical protein
MPTGINAMSRRSAWPTNEVTDVPRSATNSAEFQSLDPHPAQDYIAAVMMNDTQIIVRRRRAKMARANVFV